MSSGSFHSSGANRLQAKRSIAKVGDGNMMKKTKAVLGDGERQGAPLSLGWSGEGFLEGKQCAQRHA